MKTLHIRTYGCQMNVYDSDRMAETLGALGWRLVEAPDAAALVLLNTCHIREKAADKMYSELGRLSALKRARRDAGDGDLNIIVAGCVAQAEGEEITRRNADVDIVVGPQAYHRLPELLAKVARGRDGRGLMALDFEVEPKFDSLPERAESGPAAFLTVQEGCDKFCSFCVVPYTRGAETSRPPAAILAEARRLAALGAREITVLGQNVNAFAADGPDGRSWGLGRLIRALAEIDGVARLRYTTSHPRDMDDDLIAAHGEVPALQPFLHLPVQSGSDAVLDAMNRGHDAALYDRVVDKLRMVRPDLALSSDFIVGHPGERAADFDATMALVDRIGFAQAYSFKYSPRHGTPAATLPQIAETEKTARLNALQSLLLDQRTAFNRGFEGGEVQILFEKRDARTGRLTGRTAHWQSAYADGPDAAIGDIRRARVLNAGPNAVSTVLEDAEKSAA